MIKLNNVNKYFNKHKKNEIHVIDNTSLTLEDTGLVALLGSSGSGKTTLLNSIGGLDKVSSGDIFINNERITRRSIRKVDEIRNLNIGYIFQDYNLLNNLSVFDNVSIVLKINGIKDKEEIKKRVNYVLECVGMYRYRNRLASMLSGGERQRVGIARAIVKNPSIIIADEPTGNLDSKNTIEVMNIIKAISKTRLVILVTHEKELAQFYASRIITISDGKIVDDKNNLHDDTLDYRMDGKIYLKDIKNKVTIKEDNLNINYYNDNNEKLKINIIVKNGNIYIENKSSEKIEIIGEDNTIELVDDHYKKINKSIYEDYKFDFSDVVNSNIKEKYSSIYNLFTLLIQGFKRVLGYGFIKKLLLLGFFAASMFITYAVSSTFASIDIRDEDFIKYNKNYLVIKKNKVSVDEYNSYMSDSVNYILPGDSIVNFTVPIGDYYQTLQLSVNMKGSLSSIDMISENDILDGSMPSSSNEIVVDKSVLDYILNNSDARPAGYLSSAEFLNKSVNVSGVKDYKIVGIVDLGSPSIYAYFDEFVTIINNSSQDEFSDNVDKKIQDYKLLENDIHLVKGNLPLDYEVIINEDLKETYKLGSFLEEKINGNKLKVVGYFHSDRGINTYLTNQNTIKYSLIVENSDLMVYGNDKKKTLNSLKEKGLNVMDSYDKAREDYISNKRDSINSQLIFSGIVLGISLIEIFLIIRSSFLSRVKEVGILRAIGLKKLDIYKMFSGEILAITCLSSIPGLILMSYILNELSSISMLSRMFIIDFKVIIVSLILIFLFNLLFGLLPVFTTIRKRPARILSRTDLE